MYRAADIGPPEAIVWISLESRVGRELGFSDPRGEGVSSLGSAEALMEGGTEGRAGQGDPLVLNHGCCRGDQ